MSKPIINAVVSGPEKPSATYKTKVLKGNLPFSSQVGDDNTKYVIKYDFDLDGGSVTIPTGCLLEFDGGSLSNGTVVGQETILIYHQAFADILHDVTTEGTFVWDRGTTANRPTLTIIDIGFQYFDTTLGKPVWYNGTDWVDATGAVV